MKLNERLSNILIEKISTCDQGSDVYHKLHS